MGIPVFVLGQSGTGKSTSLRNFKSSEILHINVMSKPLPFKGRFADTYNGDNYSEIAKAINKTDCKSIVIDDAQYLMANEFMRRSSEKGYDKFTEIGYNFWTLVNSVTADLPFDVIVYFLMHTDQDERGNEKAKTIGKMLDEKICLEGMTSIVLQTSVKDGAYSFLTQNNGHNTVKSPLGMFSTYEIDNDLKMVDETIRKYWELDIPFESSSQIMAEHDAEVESGGVSTDAPKAERRSRGSKTEEKTTRTRKKREETPSDEAQKPSQASEEVSEESTPRERTRRRRAVERDGEDATEIPEELQVEAGEKAEKILRRRRRATR